MFPLIKRPKNTYIFLFLLLFISSSTSVWAKMITASAFIVVNGQSGKIITSRNMHIQYAPASTIKLVTALVVRDHAAVSDRFRISQKARDVEPSKAYLTYNADYYVSHLLFALLLRSSNDAAIALAEGVSGTEASFVALMNQKCQQLGLKNTVCQNASGLPAPGAHHSTVYDLVILMNAVVRDPVLLHMLKTPTRTIKGSDGRRITLTSRNKLLKKTNHMLIGKTGYTKNAGHCFVGLREGKQTPLLFAMLGGRRLWKDINVMLERK